MIKKYIAVVILFLTIFSLTTTPVYAADTEYHENPSIAEQIFSAISLLHYYSSSLDTVLQKNPGATETALEKMPFANIPQELDIATGDFAVFGISLSNSIANLFDLWQKENELLRQYQLDEAGKLGKLIAEGLPQARDQLAQLTYAVESTGSFLNIDSASPQGELKLTYDEIMDKLRQLGDMLDLLSRPLFDIGVLQSADQDKLAEVLGITPEQLQDLLKPENINELLDLLQSAGLGLLQEIFEPTILTLVIEPLEAFVGDEVNFKVVLTANGKPLGNRDINIIFNSTQYTTIATDAQGSYQGQLKIPYWYIPDIEIQAIYYPEAQDIGTYLGSVSQITKLTIKYYTASLGLSVDGQVYPGKTPILSGIFDYGQSPFMAERKILFYFDDDEIANLNVPVSFEIPFNLASDIELRNHILTISAPANGRYAPVITNYVIEVTQATTILDLNISGIAVIPGTIDLAGELYSDVGPLENASITSKMDKSVTQIYSSQDGSFTGQIKIGMGLNLLGYQQMVVQIQPSEPWNAPLTITRDIFIINLVNCGIILVTLAALSLFLRSKLRKHSNIHSKIPTGLIEGAPLVPVAVFETKVDTNTVIIKNTRDNDDLFTSIINWYIRALKLVQGITLAMLKPQQTLREYAAESNHKLGLIGKVFFEFTYLIERLIYSSYKPTHEDLEKSRQLSHAIKKGELHNENI